MTVGIFNEILNAFVGAFAGNFGRIQPAMDALFKLLIGIDVSYLAFLVLVDAEEPVKGGLRKLFTFSAWAYVIRNFNTLATSLVDSLAQGGLIAAGHGGESARRLLNPSVILDLGFRATEPLTDAISQASVLAVFGSIGIIVLSYVCIMAAYGIIALTVMITLIEYYIALAVTGLLLPFGVFSPTRWMAMKPLSYFLSCGLKLMVLTFLLAISREVLERAYFASPEPTMRELWIGTWVSLGIAMLAWFGPRGLAGGIMSGSASLGSADAIGVVSATVMALSRGSGGGAGRAAGAAGAGAGNTKSGSNGGAAHGTTGAAHPAVAAARTVTTAAARSATAGGATGGNTTAASGPGGPASPSTTGASPSPVASAVTSNTGAPRAPVYTAQFITIATGAGGKGTP